jgi:hypothetical protein
MKEENLSIQDESGDRKYFTLVPNYILNHSSAIDQSLYLQMKRFAGENGKCTASKNTLIKKMGIGEKAFNKSLKYLIDHKWIEFSGNSAVVTPGGTQNIKTYKINDIWRQNLDFYEGGVESNHPAKVVSKVTKGGVKSSPKVVSEVPLIENNTIENNKKIVTKVTSETQYGDPNINSIIYYLKEKLSIPDLDGSEKINRQYARLLLQKSKKGLDGVKWLIDQAAEDGWWHNHITSTRDLWNNKVKIVSSTRSEVKVYGLEN